MGFTEGTGELFRYPPALSEEEESPKLLLALVIRDMDVKGQKKEVSGVGIARLEIGKHFILWKERQS